MIKDAYHNLTIAPIQGAFSYQDLIEAVQAQPLAGSAKGEICSAIRTANRLVAQGTMEMPAILKTIIKELDKLSPSSSGLSKGGLANLKSRIRRAFSMAREKTGKRWTALQGPWKALQQSGDVRFQRATSRFMHYAVSAGWSPEGVTDAHMDRFEWHLREEVGVSNWEQNIRDTVNCWNKAAGSPGFESLKQLTPRAVKRTRYWINETEWHPELRAEKARFLESLEGSKSFLGTQKTGLDDGTINQYGYVIIILVSALVALGTPLEQLRSFSQLIGPGNLDAVLRFVMERAAGKVTAMMLNIACRSLVIARWCKLPEAEQAVIKSIFAEVQKRLGKNRGLTDKNLSLLKRIKEDQRFADSVVLLSTELVRQARAATKSSSLQVRNRALVLMVTALAVELLITCNMRRENLIELKLGSSIRKIGQGPDQKWVLEYLEEEVKNEQPLRFELPAAAARLLEDFLANWRPQLCQTANDWLFPGVKDVHMCPKKLAHYVTVNSERVCGVPITPHQFRHIGAKLYLKDNPDGIYTVSQHLGHRDINTTRYFYAEPEQLEASRRYQSAVVLKREDAALRVKTRKRRTDKEEVL